MKKFISYISAFSVSALIVIAFLVVITGLYASSTVDFGIAKDKNVLVLGNSHPECAIDDSLLPNVYNLAQSGAGYFYDYVKANNLLENNPQIDTLVIGYSYSDIAGNMDLWFSGEERIKFKIRNYFFLFGFNDYLSMFKANPVATAMNTPQTIFHNLKMSQFGIGSLGGYKHLTRNKLAEDKLRTENDSLPENTDISKYQTDYLLKIYELCKLKNVKLVLLATPMHPEKRIAHQKTLISRYCNFAKNQMPEAILINNTNFTIPEEDYADLSHLNFKGAQLYTEHLKKVGFDKVSDSCVK